MKRILCGLIISFCLFPNIINALECSTSDKERLQRLASNITYTLEEYEENGETYFRATFTGLSKELRIYSDRKHFYYYNNTNNDIGEVELYPLYSGRTYQFTVNGHSTCSYNNFRTITISIPNYNPYYNDPVCNNAREYKLCQKWFDSGEISHDEFTNSVSEYIKAKKDNNNGEGGNGNLTDPFEFNFDFGKFYKLVYFPSLVVTIILLILLVIFWNKENKKNRL